jgi:hypothetical protein
MNHWETFKIMRQACTREGVVAVAAKNQTLKPFVDAAAADVALLTSRLEVLDPGQIKAYFGKSAAELEKLRHNLVAKRRSSAWCRKRLWRKRRPRRRPVPRS